MLSIDQISKINHTEYYFPNQKGFCDVFLGARSGKPVLPEQVDRFNRFTENYSRYLEEINQFVLNNLKFTETISAAKIQQAAIEFHVIDVPYETHKYDFVRGIPGSFLHVVSVSG